VDGAAPVGVTPPFAPITGPTYIGASNTGPTDFYQDSSPANVEEGGGPNSSGLLLLSHKSFDFR
jgi:hypothetical protein